MRHSRSSRCPAALPGSAVLARPGHRAKRVPREVCFKGPFRSVDLWVMGPSRFHCATLNRRCQANTLPAGLVQSTGHGRQAFVPPPAPHSAIGKRHARHHTLLHAHCMHASPKHCGGESYLTLRWVAQAWPETDDLCTRFITLKWCSGHDSACIVVCRAHEHSFQPCACVRSIVI